MTEPLEALLQRVQAATGADPQLDRDIAIDLRDWSGYVQTPSRNIHEKMLAYTGTLREPKLAVAMWPEPVTASIDAALALVERLLPTFGVQVGHPLRETRQYGWYASVFRSRLPTEFGTFDGHFDGGKDHGTTEPYRYFPNGALAILAALLTALITQNKGTDQ